MGNRSGNSLYNAPVTRSRPHHLLILLLPLLALRAMLPTGFMPTPAEGELRLVLCSEGLLPQADDAAGSDHPPSTAGECPFAQTAFQAPPPQFLVLGTAPLSARAALPPASQWLPPSTGPPRTAGARAPPALS